jgi:hypothetical protein
MIFLKKKEIKYFQFEIGSQKFNIIWINKIKFYFANLSINSISKTIINIGRFLYKTNQNKTSNSISSQLKN